jgi:hypothetical protein
MSTRIGFPSFCAALNSAWVNGFQGAGENAGGEEKAMRDHLLRTSGLVWFAYCSAGKLAANHYALTRP